MSYHYVPAGDCRQVKLAEQVSLPLIVADAELFRDLVFGPRFEPIRSVFLSAQETVTRAHPWYSVRRLEAVSHFPMLEVPDETARVIREFIQ